MLSSQMKPCLELRGRTVRTWPAADSLTTSTPMGKPRETACAARAIIVQKLLGRISFRTTCIHASRSAELEKHTTGIRWKRLPAALYVAGCKVQGIGGIFSTRHTERPGSERQSLPTTRSTSRSYFADDILNQSQPLAHLLKRG